LRIAFAGQTLIVRHQWDVRYFVEKPENFPIIRSGAITHTNATASFLLLFALLPFSAFVLGVESGREIDKRMCVFLFFLSSFLSFTTYASWRSGRKEWDWSCVFCVPGRGMFD